MDFLSSVLLYQLPVEGIGAYIGTLLLFYLVYLVADSISQSRQASLLKLAVETKKVLHLPPTFSYLSIPLGLYEHFSAKQINSILHASNPVAPVQTQFYLSPFHFHRKSIQVKTCGEMVDIIVGVDALVSCKIEVYAGVKLDSFKEHGLTQELIVDKRAEKRKGKQKAIDPTSPKDEAYEMDSKLKKQGFGFVEGSLLRSDEAVYMREVTLSAGRKQEIKLEGIPFVEALPSQEETSTRQEATLEGELAHVKGLMAGDTEKRVPFVLIARPLTQQLNYKAMELNGAVDLKNTSTWLLLFGNKRKASSEEPDNVNTPDKSKEQTVFSLEYARELLRAERVPIVPSSLGLPVSEEQQMELVDSWEVDELFGGLPSTQSLNEEQDEDSLPQCCVCLTDPSQVTILPCRHLCMCLDCWKTGEGNKAPQQPALVTGTEKARVSVKWSGCPVCRSAVKSWVEMESSPRSSDVLKTSLVPKSPK